MTLLEATPYTPKEGLQLGSGWSPGPRGHPGKGKTPCTPKSGEASAASWTPLAKAHLRSMEKTFIRKSELHPLTRWAAKFSAAEFPP